MAYYKARNKASSITHAMAWVNLENIIVHEISQSWQILCDFIYIKVSRKANPDRQKVVVVVSNNYGGLVNGG